MMIVAPHSSLVSLGQGRMADHMFTGEVDELVDNFIQLL